MTATRTSAYEMFSRLPILAICGVALMRCGRLRRAGRCAVAPACRHGRFHARRAADPGQQLFPLPRAGCGRAREADLRLDVWRERRRHPRRRGGHRSPGKPDESELIARITSDDPDVRMPPADSGKTLTPEQIETLRQWVAQGAKYKQHWAFVAPQRPAVPAGEESRLGSQSDRRVRAGAAGKRRPRAVAARDCEHAAAPAVARPDRPAADARGDRRVRSERPAKRLSSTQVERLLASPHYGERWGRIWLDAARYADSDGFEKDKPRFVWMYRDWVINALNADMPYDQFIIEQIAGDLLPNADAGSDGRHRLPAELDDQRRGRHRSRAVPHGGDVRPHGRDRQGHARA